jgi:WhiB family redox-sensing transcriptional regulator
VTRSRATGPRSRAPAPRLPAPDIGVWAWQLRALCRGVDSSAFFPPDGERGHARARREARAKDMCGRCPVVQQCRAHALNVGEPYGVWGGLSESDRQALTGSPRKRCGPAQSEADDAVVHTAP